MPNASRQSSAAALALALAVVYVAWGSTYLGMRVASETIPPLTMLGLRFAIAGTIVLPIAARGAGWPTREEWRWGALSGTLMLGMGTGGIVLAVQHITSGLAAVLASSISLWMVLLDWVRPGGRRPTWLVLAGIALGVAGLVVLVDPGRLGGARVDAASVAFVVGGSLAWAVGTMLARGAARPRTPLLGAAVQMLGAGAALLLAGALRGELHDLVAPSARSWGAVAYLIVVGSFGGFTAYAWLVQHARPALLSTYSYVNPVVALLLGRLIGRESLPGRALGASALIVASVVLVALDHTRDPT